MRRKDREVTDLNRIFDIVGSCSVVHIGMADGGKPYVVAVNFGFERQGDALVLYFHSACEGRKTDILRENPNIYFQMDCANEPVFGSKENPCAFSFRYDSVMGSGQAEVIESAKEKNHALNCIIRHLSKTEETYEFPEAMLKRTCVYRVVSVDMTGKHCR